MQPPTTAQDLFTGFDPGEPGIGDPEGDSNDLYSLGIHLVDGAISLTSHDAVLIESTTGDVVGNSTSSFTISGTNGTLSAVLVTSSGIGMDCLVTVTDGHWLLTYSGTPLDPDEPLSEIHGLIYGAMSASGTTSLTDASLKIAGQTSNSLVVFDDITLHESEALLATYEASHVSSYGAVSMSARWSWNWGDFWIGCGAGAVTGGIGGAVVGSPAGGVGALPGAAIGALIGCATGGFAAGGAGNVIPNDNPDDLHVVQSICIGGVVGGVCGTVGVYIIPGPTPPPPPPGSDPHTQYVLRQYMAKAGMFNNP